MITNQGVLKIVDFGLARIYSKNEKERQYSHQVATRWYRAPELLYGSRDYTPAVDLWAVGCIFVELLNRCPLFPVCILLFQSNVLLFVTRKILIDCG